MHHPSSQVRSTLFVVIAMTGLMLTAAGASTTAPAITRTHAPATIPQRVPQEQGARDVLGWRQARWGMTDEQVAAAFLGELSRRDPITRPGDSEYIMYDIPKYGVDRDTFDVIFSMDSTARTLKEVALLAMSRQPQFDTFDRMEAALIRKYGAPTSKSEHENLIGAVEANRMWVFPTTIVELTMNYNKTIPANWLTVRYHPAADSTASKL